MGEPKNPFGDNFNQKLREALRQISRNPHIPGAILEIDESARTTLLRIKEKVKTSPRISLAQSAQLEDGPNHQKFQNTKASDMSAVSLALSKKETPARFIAHVGGGHEFLEHILECPTCFFDVAEPLWEEGK